MQQLIQVFHQNKAAGIFSLDETTNEGRFEWLPDFRVSFNEFVKVFEVESDNHIIRFDSTHDLPPCFRNQSPGMFSKLLLKTVLREEAITLDKRSTLSWLSLMGSRGMGGFRFEPAGLPELDDLEPVDLDKMVRYAGMVLQGRGSELSDRRLRELLRCGLFAPGNSPKILIAANDFTGEVLSGQGKIPDGYTAWIVKLDGVTAGSAENLALEYEYFKKAEACGIQTATCRMMRDGDWKHLLVKRFDRISNQKTLFVHCPYCDFSWESVFELMRKWRFPYPDMAEMYKRMLFSILTANKDFDHRKICFTFTAKDRWRLAPAFNLKPKATTDSYSLSLHDKWKAWSEAELLDFGRQINIRQARKYLDKIKATI